MDAFSTFPKKEHHDRWHTAAATDPSGSCPGKDTLDNACTCPDVVYATRVRIATGTTINFYLYCGCCDLPIAVRRP